MADFKTLHNMKENDIMEKKALVLGGQKMKIKIFEGRNLQEAMNKLLAEGFKPASSELVWKLRDKKKIPMQLYDTSNVIVRGKVRQASLKELKDLKKVYELGGRVLWLGGNCNSLNGCNLDNGGCFVGIKRR